LSQQPQLYDLQTDLAEKNNVADKNPDMVKHLQAALEKIKLTTTTKNR
jgi:hypothetical protein